MGEKSMIGFKVIVVHTGNWIDSAYDRDISEPL